jgi:hypothetical protein
VFVNSPEEVYGGLPITEALLVDGVTHVLCADVIAHRTTSQVALFLLLKLHYVMLLTQLRSVVCNMASDMLLQDM